MTDTELIDYLEKQEGVALISDDQGFWAVVDCGMQSIDSNPPNDVSASFFIEKEEWKPSVREAILAYIKK